MLRAALISILLSSNALLAQDICFQDDFEKLKTNIDANCRSLLVSNILFMYNGMEYQVIGETSKLDSFTDYVARNDALYEVHFETKDKNWSEDQVSLLEKNICDYILSRDSSCADKVKPESSPKKSLKHQLPENMRSAFFMVMMGYQDKL